MSSMPVMLEEYVDRDVDLGSAEEQLRFKRNLVNKQQLRSMVDEYQRQTQPPVNVTLEERWDWAVKVAAYQGKKCVRVPAKDKVADRLRDYCHDREFILEPEPGFFGDVYQVTFLG